MKNKIEFKRLMNLLAEQHDRQISVALNEFYWLALGPYTDDVCISALSRCLTECGFFPKIYDIIKIIKENEPKAIDIAQSQVNEIMTQVRNIGSWGTPVFSDPVTNRLMSSRWSWKSLCSMTETEHKWWAKDFIEAYQSCDRTDQKQIGSESPRLKLLAGGIGKI